MSIDEPEVRRVAALARLSLDDAELATVAVQLNAVLEFIAAIDRLDLAGSEPVTLAPAGQPRRADAPDGRTLPQGAATAGAPDGDEDFFFVPPVVENLEP